MHWLLSDCHFFGLPAQNWMWVFPGGLVLYGVILIYIRSRRAKLGP
jgi:cytochrome c-type biogenesis protein CcmH/NrfF